MACHFVVDVLLFGEIPALVLVVDVFGAGGGGVPLW